MRIKFKLFTDEHGQPQVKMENPDLPFPLNRYWRQDGTLSFLQAMADDPDHPLEELDAGVYLMPKF